MNARQRGDQLSGDIPNVMTATILARRATIAAATAAYYAGGPPHKRPHIVTRAATFALATAATEDVRRKIPIGGHTKFAMACILTAAAPLSTTASNKEKVWLPVDDNKAIGLSCDGHALPPSRTPIPRSQS